MFSASPTSYTFPLAALTLPHIPLHPGRPVSDAFIHRGCQTFADAAQLVHSLRYSRPNNSGIFTILDAQCGTCSTKHILLYRLIHELELPDWKLVLGIYRMNKVNTPLTGPVLHAYHIPFVPEAHVFLEHKGIPADFTFPGSSSMEWLPDLLWTGSFDADSLEASKVSIHRQYLQWWINRQPGFPYDLEQLWAIREACILALSSAG